MAAHRTSISAKPLPLDLTLLNGWKEIASYLGKGVRTVQRYERDLQLPVRRPAGRLRGSVIVSCNELDQWVSASPTKPHPRAQLIPQRVLELKSGILQLQRLPAEGRELMAALRVQRTALEFHTLRTRETLSNPAMLKTEQHRSIAAEQKQRAIEMRESARRMTDQAIEMRKAPRRRLTGSC